MVGCRSSAASSFVVTGGSDRRIRFWDLQDPARSSLVSAGAYDPVRPNDLSYESVSSFIHSSYEFGEMNRIRIVHRFI